MMTSPLAAGLTLVPRRHMNRLITEWRAAGPVISQVILSGVTVGPEWSWLPPSARESGTGLVLIELPSGGRVAVAPPFPVVAAGDDGLAGLESLLTARQAVGIVLLRLGRYAVGVAVDEILSAPKSGHRYVHGRHKAGGQSQHRYEHNRENWMSELFDEVCAEAAPRFRAAGLIASGAQARAPAAVRNQHWLALGGDRLVLGSFLDHCTELQKMRGQLLPWRVPVERPGSDALRRAVTLIWAYRVYSEGPLGREPAPLPFRDRGP